MAREALGIAGAVVGAYFGGPVGASIGFSIGSAIGGYIDPIKIPAPSLNDAPIQTSRDGVPITLFWGLQYGHGNIIQKNPEEIVTTTERQGKGGPEVETTQRFRTFAIGVGQTTVGAISEITRIWENNRLVYDVRTVPAIPAAETAKYAEGITIYLGDESQLPDPELEAYWTAAETPAYRGLCYIVWNDKDLTDVGGAIPQFAFEVNGSRDATVTSKPYPIEAIDGIDVDPLPLNYGPIEWPLDPIDAGIALLSWDVRQLLIPYAWEEGIDILTSLLTWDVRSLLNEYEYEPEGIDVGMAPQTWLIEPRLVTYTYEPEGVNVGMALLTWSIH